MKLYRTRTDPDPILIEGSHGDLEVELVEPCTLYYEFFPETQNFKIFTTGWRDPAGRGGGP